MKKFAVCIVKGDDVKIVSAHLSKDEALENGEIANKQLLKDDGTVSCIFGNFDDNNKLIENKYQIHKVWI